MIGYRFLSLAEEEMSEAAVFYDAASTGLGRAVRDIGGIGLRIKTLSGTIELPGCLNLIGQNRESLRYQAQFSNRL